MKTIQDVTQKMEEQIREKVESISEDDDLITVRFRRPKHLSKKTVDTLQNTIGDIHEITVGSSLYEPFGALQVNLLFLLRINT